jgi:hypothetical protein
LGRTYLFMSRSWWETNKGEISKQSYVEIASENLKNEYLSYYFKTSSFCWFLVETVFYYKGRNKWMFYICGITSYFITSYEKVQIFLYVIWICVSYLHFAFILFQYFPFPNSNCIKVRKDRKIKFWGIRWTIRNIEIFHCNTHTLFKSKTMSFQILNKT